MASNFIPMLSSSPPPLEDSGSIDDDDEDFGDFASALKVLDSPLDSPIKKFPDNNVELPPLKLTIEKDNVETSSVESFHFEFEKDDVIEIGIKVEDLNDEKSLCNGVLKDITIEETRTISDESNSSVERTHCESTFRTVSFSLDPVHNFSDDDNDDEDEDEDDEETLTHSNKCSLTPKYDNISQESVSDSGLCSSSQWSDSSPLPQNELAFSSDVSPDEELLSRKNMQDTDPDPEIDTDMKQLNYKHCNGNSESPNEHSVENEQEKFESTTDQHVRNYLDSLPKIQDSIVTVNESLSVSRFDSSCVVSCDIANKESTDIKRAEQLNQDEVAEEEEDDFADFESAFDSIVNSKQCFTNQTDFSVEIATKTEKELEETVTEVNATDDSFADFASASFAEYKEESAPDDEWANFESSWQEETTSEFGLVKQIKDTEAPKRSLMPNDSLQRIKSAFPILTEDISKPVDSISPNLLGAITSSSHNVWSLLEDLDQSLCLRYQWTGSETFQNTLHSLNIDARNILRNPSVPVFALGLGLLLEPVKVDTISFDEEIVDKPLSTVVQEENIPPAQFDWNSSGLVNPLDPSQANSALLDLDFFVTSIASSSSKSIAKTFSLEEELLGQQIEPPLSAGRKGDSTSQQNVILEKLLLTMKSTHCTIPKQQQRPANLSSSTVQILDRIPDLSFMRAKVLMFPVRSQQDS